MRIRQLTLLGSALLLVAFMPHKSTAPDKWAVFIGISDYMNFGPEIGGDLPGASWDARRMRDVYVERRGFMPDHVKLILDTAATRARIMRELTVWLPSVVKEGDEVVVFFAGHGSQQWDTNGDESDGLDETICPTDVMKGDTRADIGDDELELWLSKIPTRDMHVILDNCHAGSGTRAVTPFARPRSLDRTVAVDVAKPSNATAASSQPASASAINASGWNEFAAAQADEVAVDAEWPGENGRPATFGGAFTTSFVRNMWKVSRRTSYKDVFDMTVEDMKRERFAQQPVFTANRNPMPASAAAADAADDSAVPVTGVKGGVVQLAGGISAGITPGSMYRAGAAVLRVTSVTSSGASAAIVSGAPPRAGASATLTAYAYPRVGLKVSVADLTPATRTSVEAATRAIPGLTVVTQPRDFAHLIIRPSADGYVIIGMDGALRHEIKGGRAQATAEIGRVLRNEADANALASLDNPGQAKPLEFTFDGGKTSFHEEDPIVFTVTSPTAGYLTIVDLGTDGAITVLYPAAGQSNQVKAGQSVRLPPEDNFEAQRPFGRGIVRAFVTQKPMGLHHTDDRKDDAKVVTAALRSALGATATTAALPVSNWSTAALVYTVQKK